MRRMKEIRGRVEDKTMPGQSPGSSNSYSSEEKGLAV